MTRSTTTAARTIANATDPKVKPPTKAQKAAGDRAAAAKVKATEKAAAAKTAKAEKKAAELAALTVKVAELSAQGLNCKTVAAKLNAPESKVYKIRVSLGIKRSNHGSTSAAPAHDKSPEAVALRAAIAAVQACGISMNVAARWAREDEAAA